MWLLRTSTAELQFFNGPYDVKGGYAILSHVWQDCEQSFEELQSLRSQIAASGQQHLLRSRVSDKIRECCILAEAHGYDWLWIDTCCIDRSSSSELSEAINSMYQWYSHAQVCYAYLQDVPSTCTPHNRGSAFRGSKWFTRGWTLQELIAPRSLIFIAQDWSSIGTKASMAPLLEDITGVDADVLTFRRNLGDVSVARRMWWASARKTTRVEDEAYCLMGIFDVHMATIYGEGRRAFLRLQEEILKRTSDQTLFAWGNVLPIRTTPFREQMTFSKYHQDSHIFAPSPASFVRSGDMHPVPMHLAAQNAVKALGVTKCTLDSSKPAKHVASRECKEPWKIPLPDFMVTSHGVRARLLVIESSAGQSTLAIAVLACKDKSTGSFVGLLLRRRVDNETGLKYPRYHVGITIRGMHAWMRLRYRLSQVDWARHALSFNSSGIVAHWQRLYISHRSPSRSPPPRTQSDTIFRFLFPRWLKVELAKQGFEPDKKLPEARSQAVKLAGKASIATFTLTHRALQESIRIHVGTCQRSPWATVTFIAHGQPGRRPLGTSGSDSSSSAIPVPVVLPKFRPRPRINHRGHAVQDECGCGPETITRWPNGSRVFGDTQRSVQLTFTRTTAGGSTHLLDVRIGGSVYQTAAGMLQSRSRELHTLTRPLMRMLL
ncbi:heterokaryon incompatibility protein-domain-containing protein [Cubamyces menziesii]|uniref:HET-domain-containing protein n=1 Tax=Trametes cubensis TaxID=1111947 RepID=A0AAD7X8F6_9APHY|nr:heterokaryon incompatibility protein-domain-containing protein [Cubamyces menziesii]KAJ8468980.1 hypothetical protein ONZ51_g9296 [Trametes cubensis]